MSTRREMFKKLAGAAAALVGIKPKAISIPKGFTTWGSVPRHYWPPILDDIAWRNEYQPPDFEKYYAALMKAYDPQPSKFKSCDHEPIHIPEA